MVVTTSITSGCCAGGTMPPTQSVFMWPGFIRAKIDEKKREKYPETVSGNPLG
jgi:hypothetical protein